MVELQKLEIEGFGKFNTDKVINFKKGINFITGLNETGKSTILEAFLASLFKYTSIKIQPYYCWNNPDVCRVSLTYTTDDGETFRVTSDYLNSKRKLEKVEKSRNKEISSSGSVIEDYIKKHFGFDEQKVFENTSFIRQSQMAILGDKPTKNKIRDMIEEVFVGTAEASATKTLQKIKKLGKDSRKEAEGLSEELYQLKDELNQAEQNKEGLVKDSEEYESTSGELSKKSELLKKLKENKELFDKKEILLKEAAGLDDNIRQIDDMIETLESGAETTAPSKSKALPIILIVVGLGLCLTKIGAIIGIPLIIVGIVLLLKKDKVSAIPTTNVNQKASQYKQHKKDLINKKAVADAKLEKYKLVNFTIDDFRELDTLEKQVNELKERTVELRTGISKTKELVKSPEEIQEEVDSTEQKIFELKEKAEECDLAAQFLEEAEREVQNKFTPAIENNSKETLKEVTGGKYSLIKINEETLDITVKAPEINEFVAVDYLSQGAKDQVYFTVRTAMSDLLSGNINIPLIFDDPFHNFDDVRLKKTISAVQKIAAKKQIILISHRPYNNEFKNFADNIIEVK